MFYGNALQSSQLTGQICMREGLICRGAAGLLHEE